MSSLVPFIVKKYLRFDKTQPFISITAILAFLGVVVGVGVLMNAMAIMNGFDRDFRKKLFTMNYPITVQQFFSNNMSEKTLKKLEKRFPSMLFSPYIQTGAMLKKGEILQAVILVGVDKKKEILINDVYKTAVLDLNNTKPFGAIVGSTLSNEFGVDIGQRVLIVFTNASPIGLSTSALMKRFEVKSVFHSGLIAYDRSIVYVELKDLKKILRRPSFAGIHVHSKDPMKDIEDIKEFLGKDYRVVGWWQKNGNFFSALQMEKQALFIVLMLIILVASLNIVTSMLMTIMSKRREIALLLCLGATQRQIKKIFFYIGSVIGLLGVIVGVIIGFVLMWVLGNYEIVSLPADVYGDSKLPIYLPMTDFIGIVVGATIIVLLSAYYPSKKASELDALTVLRNE